MSKNMRKRIADMGGIFLKSKHQKQAQDCYNKQLDHSPLEQNSPVEDDISPLLESCGKENNPEQMYKSSSSVELNSVTENIATRTEKTIQNRGKISRRLFLRGSATAIATALAQLNGLPGFGIPHVNARSNVIRFGVQSFAHPLLQDILQDFEGQTGYQIQLIATPSSGIDLINQFRGAFASSSHPYDLLSTSDDGLPLMLDNSWLEPLDHIVQQEVQNDFDSSIQDSLQTWNYREGSLYRLPHELMPGFFFYRADWFDERNLNPPETWDDIVELADEFRDEESNVWSMAEGLKRPGLLAVYVTYLAQQAGGNILEFDDGTLEGIQFLYDLIYTHKVLQESSLDTDYGQQNDLYMNDKVAFMRQWPFFQAVVESNSSWYSPEKTRITLPPAGPVRSASWVSQHGYTIPIFADNKEGAADLLRFLVADETAVRLAEGNPFFMSPRAAMKTYFEGKNNPIFDALQIYTDANVLQTRPHHLRVNEIQALIEDVVEGYLNNKVDFDTMAKQGRERILALR